jgi:hypothetical protein
MFLRGWKHEMVHAPDSNNGIPDAGGNAGSEHGIHDHRFPTDEKLARQDAGHFIRKTIIMHPPYMGERLGINRGHADQASFR